MIYLCSIQTYTNLYTHIQAYTSIYKCIQTYTNIYIHILYKRIQAYTNLLNVYICIHSHYRVPFVYIRTMFVYTAHGRVPFERLPFRALDYDIRLTTLHFISETRTGFRCQANAQALDDRDHTIETTSQREFRAHPPGYLTPAGSRRARRRARFSLTVGGRCGSQPRSRPWLEHRPAHQPTERWTDPRPKGPWLPASRTPAHLSPRRRYLPLPPPRRAKFGRRAWPG